MRTENRPSGKPAGLTKDVLEPSADTLWLNEQQTARRLNMSQKWLQKERLIGGGLRYAKFGSAVRYALSDIERYERDRLRSSTSDLGTGAEVIASPNADQAQALPPAIRTCTSERRARGP